MRNPHDDNLLHFPTCVVIVISPDDIISYAFVVADEHTFSSNRTRSLFIMTVHT